MRAYLYLIPNLLILWIFLIYYFAMPRLRVRRNRTFLILLAVQTLAMFLGIALEIAGEHHAPDSVLFALYSFYGAAIMTRVYCCFHFVTEVLRLRSRNAPARGWVSRWMYYGTMAILLVNFFTKTAFHVENGSFVMGPMYGLSYRYFVLLSIGQIIVLRKRLAPSQFVSLLCCQGILLAGHINQVHHPSNLVSSTAGLMVTIILFLVFENPNLYLAHRGSAFNIRGFREQLDEMLAKKSYRILSFGIRDYIDMRGIYGGRQLDTGVSLISQYLVKTWREYTVFYLRSGRFVMLGPASMDWDAVRGEIENRFHSPWVADNAELDLSVAFVQLEAGVGPDTVDGILNCLFLTFDNENDVMTHADNLIDREGIQEIERMIEVKRALERSVERNEVEIFLQPLINGKNRRLAGAEVLCRIRDDAGRLISPAVFVPIAEKNGRISLMGEQVLEKACQFVRDHDLDAIGLSWLNVNLSPIQCMKKDLSQRFAMILEQYGVSTEIIHLEITEQSVLDIPRLENQIRVLRSNGFCFSLDDYGSGYSNLSRVKQYPFANIKLDMSVVWDYFRDRDTLLPKVVQGFKEMGFSVTAEGIETAEIADAMCSLGCDYLQGYFFSKPLPAEEFVEKYTLLNRSYAS